MRPLLYAHTAIIVATAFLILAETNDFERARMVRVSYLIVPVFFLAIVVCPVTFAVIYCTSAPQVRSRWSILAEVMLWCIQIAMLIPTIGGVNR